MPPTATAPRRPTTLKNLLRSLALGIALLVAAPAPAIAAIVIAVPCDFGTITDAISRPERTPPTTPAPATSSALSSATDETGGTTGSVVKLGAIALATIGVSPPSIGDGIINDFYRVQFAAAGGTAPYTFECTGELPDGLTLDEAGILSGTPLEAGTFDFTVTATDSLEVTGSRDYSLTIKTEPVLLSPLGLPGGTIGIPYSEDIDARGGGDPPYTFIVTAGALPDGLSIDPNTGTIAGTPTTAGGYDFRVTAIDATEASSGSHDYAVDIVAPSIVLDPLLLADATVGTPYAQPITASGGAGPYGFAITAGNLPAGLSMGADGKIEGTPEEAGDFAFTVTATDAFGQTGAQAYDITVQAATIVLAPATLAEGTVGSAYHQPLMASGGTAPYSFAIMSGGLPTGMSMDGDGIVDGVPEEAGTFEFIVTVTDALEQVGERPYVLVIQAPTIALMPTALPDADVGVDYAVVLGASGGTAPYTFAVTAGALPPGMYLSSDGTLDGAPTTAGDYAFTVTATDNYNQTGSQAYDVTVQDATILLAPPSLPVGIVGTPYAQPVTASGGTGPYSYAITAGALPAGMSMDGDGIIDGTPEEAGSFAITITATDTFEQAGEQPYVLVIQAPVIALMPTVLPDADVGTDYGHVITASGGHGPYTFAVTGGTLPPGLFLSSDGALDGSPVEAGSFGFTVTATDNYDQTGTQAYDVTVRGADILLAPPALPGGVVGTPYTQPITASGGTGPYSFAITSGALPSGMSMDGDGIVDGTPEEAGSFTFTVTATDAFEQSGEHAYELVVQAPDIVLAPDALPTGSVGSDYEHIITASGGHAPYTFAVTSGTPPPGVFLSSDGTLEGTPIETGSFGFTVTATGTFNQAGERAYVLEVDGATVVLAPASLPGGIVGTPYAQTVTASGGHAPYAFEITEGALPAGLSMDGDGMIDGTPEEAGSFAFTVTATDTFAQSGQHAYMVEVAGAEVVLSPTVLADGAVGTPYAQPLTARGGHAPYSFEITAGALPTGMSMDANGVLGGTPGVAGTFAFTVAATDAFGQVGEQPLSLTIRAPDIVVSPNGTLPGATRGMPYHLAVTASGGTAPYRFGLHAGGLPAGITLDDDGGLSGTPTEAGSFEFIVVANDAFDQQGEASLVLVVEAAAIAIAPGSLPAPSVGVPYRLEFDASGGVAPYAFALGGGTLPPGLVLGSDGVLAGTPTSAGDYLFTIVATDASGNAGEQDYLLSLAALPDPTDDPEVIGLVTSQVSTVRTFVTTQIGNVQHHLESLHDGGATGWSFWIAGSVRSGDRDGSGEVSPLSFETSGLTGGSDFRLNQELAFGGGLGYARDRTAIGNDGSRNEGDAPSGVSYMSWHPEDMPFFLDGMGGYQDLEFDVRRVTSGGATFLSRRLGKQRFTSWQGGYEYSTDTFMFSPYGRVDAASARLDGFREEGGDPLALQFGSQDVDLRTTTLGFRMHYRMQTGWGEWEPRVRLEYQRDFHEDDGVSIRYANQATSPVFFTTPIGLDEDRFVLELGSIFRTNWYGLLIRVDYLGVYGGANDNEHGLTFSFQED